MEKLYEQLDLEPLNDTQIKILEGTKQCVLNWGQAKTSLNDIAKQAGVTRPTVYAYYKTKEEVIKQALLYSGYEFSRKLIESIQPYETPSERFLEAVLFAIEELPKEPYLRVITSADLGDIMKNDALKNPKGVTICLEIFNQIFEGLSLESWELAEIIEVTVRMTLSLITIESPLRRSREELKAFLQRRLLPLIVE